ncbi:TIGR04282 family arsenosugar biosynthesis glycosyltransferase [Ascidiimonas sp. W6]|uniref:TIGR04282 family arsenosugar biosynthesis glycosyltransferase n=1 Tax=Ascidiimonas meishanensis TaxID=3128903 RepID=UPI0030EB2B02
MTKRALLIFTRNPVIGKVKTRLAKTVGDQTALDIYTFLLERTVQVTTPIVASKFVYYSEEIKKEDIWNASGYTKKLQKGAHLGIRMLNAFKEAFEDDYQSMLIIGSDMYDITPAHINDAFRQLEANDVVIGPAEDGGYYLLGLTSLIPEIFENKKWGTSTVLKDTLAQLTTKKIHLLERLNDIDIYEDIENHHAFKPFLKPTD